ncbi:DNA-(apurinic or apyrimidinic site) lyase [Grifola frondosa]|uniref:DNA-(Apurinic or apyrimidinic site) lyase n=1 Tax=Grifola frondosa TaxID=5627 RepID=A0A1C7MF65_GRIFR|nr:DNA-(apurinic or apyrimidinic site) lyase [Grifola frondosa]
MAPRKAASKRKASEAPDSEAEYSQPTQKKTKVSPPANTQPTNKVLPVHIEFPPRNPGTIRIATWNICGLASSQKKGFRNYVDAEDPDVLILTETKVNDVPTDPYFKNRYPHRHWSLAEKKGYAGTAILSKHKPVSVHYTLPVILTKMR